MPLDWKRHFLLGNLRVSETCRAVDSEATGHARAGPTRVWAWVENSESNHGNRGSRETQKNCGKSGNRFSCRNPGKNASKTLT